jgi:glycosyltransferase involved in cell wall biosynthesis
MYIPETIIVSSGEDFWQRMEKLKRPLLLVEALAARNDSGLGKLVRMFVEGLKGLAADVDIRVLSPGDGDFRPGPHCIHVPVNPRPMRLWTQIAFPMIIRNLRPDAVLCLGWTLPLWRPRSRYGLLIADVGPLEDLGMAMSSHEEHNRRWLRRMPARADLILTNAEITRRRMTALLGIPGERIKVVRPIHRDWFADRNATGPGRPPAGPYFLAVGNVEPRKNFPGLIRAYAELRRRRPEVPPLFIAGHKAWGFAAAEEEAARLGVSDSVRFTGYLSDADRNAYLANCTVFISSSLYEGWGLPLFEALAFGRPAIYHKGSSQEEFANGLALSVDCGSASQLAGAMESLWSDPIAAAKSAEALRSGFPAVLDYDLEGALRAAVMPLLRP